MPTGRFNISWLDYLRVLATISVILLHVAANILYQFNELPRHAWWTANIFDSIVRFSVPVFVMITGALFLPKQYELGEFYKKRLFRVVLPFLFWNLIYMIQDLGIRLYRGQRPGVYDTLIWSLDQLWEGASFHLWYVYMIMGIYLLIPILGPWIRRCNETTILIFLGIWVVPLLFNKYNPDYFPGYIGYLVLGYYLANKTFVHKRRNIITIGFLLLITGIAITAVGTYIFTLRYQQFYDRFYAFLSINVCMAASGVFLLVKEQAVNYQAGKLARLINKYSYGIYLSHLLVLYFLGRIGIDHLLFHPAFGIPFTTLICLAVSTALVYAIHKLPGGKYISG